MNKEELVKRVAEIQAAVDQSVANHHALCGRLAEAKHMLEMMEKCTAEQNCPTAELVEDVA